MFNTRRDTARTHRCLFNLELLFSTCPLQNMQHMAQFVYDMYNQKISFVTQKLEEEKERVRDAWQPPAEATTAEKPVDADAKKKTEEEKAKEAMIVNEVDDAEDLQARMGLAPKKSIKKGKSTTTEEKKGAAEESKDAGKDKAGEEDEDAEGIDEKDEEVEATQEEDRSKENDSSEQKDNEKSDGTTAEAEDDKKGTPDADAETAMEESGIEAPESDPVQQMDTSTTSNEAPNEEPVAPPPGEEGHVLWMQQQEKLRREEEEAKEREKVKKTERAKESEQAKEETKEKEKMGKEDGDDDDGAKLPLTEVVSMKEVVDKDELERLKKKREEEEGGEEESYFNPMEEHPGAASDSDEDIS